MFRGCSILSLDAKGRLAIPARFRERLAATGGAGLVATLSPFDPSLLLYPLPAWEEVEAKLGALSDSDPAARRTKQMMRGYASDCDLDAQGRILLPQQLREFARLDKAVALLGQGNRFEVWDEPAWMQARDSWLADVGNDAEAVGGALETLAL